MKRILAFAGARSEKSRSVTIAKKIYDEVIESNKGKVIGDFFTPNEINILPSTGCRNCFNKGFCPSDSLKEDTTSIFKEKIALADLIILSSPVYSHNVSGDIKNLIDRLSYWTHIFKLAGKPLILISTAMSNGAEHVLNYMNKVFTSMGSVTVKGEYFLQIESKEEVNKKIEQVIHVADSYIKKSSIVMPSEAQERLFNFYKEIINTYPEDNFEYMHWKKEGLFYKNTLEEYVVEKESSPYSLKLSHLDWNR